jgi:competence protein ComEC
VPGAQAAVPAGVVAALAAGAALALARRPGTRARRVSPRVRLAAVFAVALVALLVLPGVLRPRGIGAPPAGVLRVTALDVGQGDATLLQADGHAVLVDAGPPGTGLVGQLRDAGVRRLDALVLTHPQLDHDGAAPAVLSAIPTDLLLDGRDGDRSPTSRAVDAPLRQTRARVVAAEQGQTLHAGALTLEILWPPPHDPEVAAATAGDPNDRAIVALASAYDTSVLLTADAESPVLQPLDLAPVDVLKVSHHGSADPGLPQLLQEIHPRVAVIEVGAHNTYGHPAPSTLAALRAAGVPSIKRTDTDGTVRLDLSAPATASRATRTHGRSIPTPG